MAVLTWSWPINQLDRLKKFRELSLSVLSPKHCPLHLASLKGACLTNIVIITDRVSKIVSSRWWALLFQCGCFEPVLSALEWVASIRADRASQRLAYLFHVSVPERNRACGRLPDGYRSSSIEALVEGSLARVHHFRVFHERVSWLMYLTTDSFGTLMLGCAHWLKCRGIDKAAILARGRHGGLLAQMFLKVILGDHCAFREAELGSILVQ